MKDRLGRSVEEIDLLVHEDEFQYWRKLERLKTDRKQPK